MIFYDYCILCCMYCIVLIDFFSDFNAIEKYSKFSLNRIRKKYFKKKKLS